MLTCAACHYCLCHLCHLPTACAIIIAVKSSSTVLTVLTVLTVMRCDFWLLLLIWAVVGLPSEQNADKNAEAQEGVFHFEAKNFLKSHLYSPKAPRASAKFRVSHLLGHHSLGAEASPLELTSKGLNRRHHKKADVQVRDGSYFDGHPLKHRFRHGHSERRGPSPSMVPFQWDDHVESTEVNSHEENSLLLETGKANTTPQSRWLDIDVDFTDDDDERIVFASVMNWTLLDASCLKDVDGQSSFLPSPFIANGFVAAMRKRLGSDDTDNMFLEALYTCEDNYELRNPTHHSLFCHNNSWIGEIPECVPSGYMNDESSDICRQKAGCDHLCEMKEEDPHCFCYRGYLLLQDNKSCEDVNECEEDNGGCEFNCINKPGAYSCSCPRGYRLHIDGKHCLDKNECLLNNGHGPCQDVCTNTPGSYHCSCLISGTQLSADNHSCQDINECDHQNFNCSHTCLNTIGSAFCLCPEGFALGDDWKTCEDVNECEIEELASSCGGACINTLGSYKCTRHQGVGELSQVVVNNVICDKGFSAAGEGNCIDNDECEYDNFNCSQLCHNIPGSAYCSCLKGYELENDEKTCKVVKNCSVNNGGCHQLCNDTLSDNICSCRPGFQTHSLNSSHCVDVNECRVRNGGCSHDCINVVGSYYCVCSDFFMLADDQRKCVARTCPPVSKPKFGSIGCFDHPSLNGSFAVGTVCRTKCKKGFHLMGDPVTTCMETGEWKGTNVKCIPLACPALERPKNGNILPSSCVLGKTFSNQHCYYTCSPGFRLSGSPIRTCRSRHGWIPQDAPVCRKDASYWKQDTVALPYTNTTTHIFNPIFPSTKDKSYGKHTNKHYVHFSYELPKPFISCPRDVKVELAPRQSRTHIRLPLFKSNVDTKYVTSVPSWAKHQEGEVESGVTRVFMYVKSPLAEETASCNFSITVLDKESPQVFGCPHSFEVVIPEGDTHLSALAVVGWQEPLFTDNVKITAFWKSKEPGSTFPVGQHGITYLARDAAGNKARCKFIINVKVGDIQNRNSLRALLIAKPCIRPLEMRSPLQGRHLPAACYYFQPNSHWEITNKLDEGQINVEQRPPHRLPFLVSNHLPQNVPFDQRMVPPYRKRRFQNRGF